MIVAMSKTPTEGGSVNGALLEAFRHNSWATRQLLAGGAPAWVNRPEDADLDELAVWAEEAGQRWERLLSEPVDTERVIVVDDGALEVRAGVIVAQALHHGNAHREQICAILTSLGIEPPDIQPWEYAWATGRIWERTAAR
jgi:uncharacterized damage-inducible protein DinB